MSKDKVEGEQNASALHAVAGPPNLPGHDVEHDLGDAPSGAARLWQGRGFPLHGGAIRGLPLHWGVLCWAARPVVEKRAARGENLFNKYRQISDTFLNYRRGWLITLLALTGSGLAVWAFLHHQFGIGGIEAVTSSKQELRPTLSVPLDFGRRQATNPIAPSMQILPTALGQATLITQFRPTPERELPTRRIRSVPLNFGTSEMPTNPVDGIEVVAPSKQEGPALDRQERTLKTVKVYLGGAGGPKVQAPSMQKLPEEMRTNQELPPRVTGPACPAWSCATMFSGSKLIFLFRTDSGRNFAYSRDVTGRNIPPVKDGTWIYERTVLAEQLKPHPWQEIQTVGFYLFHM